jgi:hypothetical protein
MIHLYFLIFLVRVWLCFLHKSLLLAGDCCRLTAMGMMDPRRLHVLAAMVRMAFRDGRVWPGSFRQLYPGYQYTVANIPPLHPIFHLQVSTNFCSALPNQPQTRITIILSRPY